MDEHLQNNTMRDELRLLMIPLLHKCLNENPQDLVLFCARHFQSLIDERNSAEFSENKDLIPSDGRFKERREWSTDKKPGLQGSTSLPILNEGVFTRGRQLRETSSWNNGSSFRPIPAQRRKGNFNVADVVRQIGDPLNEINECTDAEYKSDKKGEDWESESSAPSALNVKKNKGGGNIFEDNVKSTEISDECSSPYTNNVCTSAPSTEEFEEEFHELVNLAEDSFRPTPPSSSRKKWKVETEANWQLDRSLELAETNNNVDSDDATDSYKLQGETVETSALSKKASGETVSLDSSFGFTPKINDKLVVPKRREGNASGSSVEDIESLVKSVSRSLQELIHVLCASRLYFDETLEKVKQIGNGVKKSQTIAKKHSPPRKKRSVTTLSVSDIRSQNRRNEDTPDKEECKRMKNAVDETNKSKKVDNSVNKSRSREHSEVVGVHNENIRRDKEVNNTTETINARSDVRTEKLHTKHDVEMNRRKSQAKKKNATSCEVLPQEENVEHNEKIAESPAEENTAEQHPIGNYEYQSASEFKFLNENVPQKSWRRRRNANYHQDGRSRPQFEYGNRQPPRQSRYSNEFPSARNRSSGRGYNNRIPRHMSSGQLRGFQNPERHRPSNFEGGDAFHAVHGQAQRSIGTETDFSHAYEQPRNSNARMVLESVSSSPDRGSEASGKAGGSCAKVVEKNSARNEIMKKNVSSSVGERGGGSESPRKELKNNKLVEKAPKPDSPSEKDKESKQGKREVSSIRPISSSSLNPSAKSFNPSNFKNNESSVKCSEKHGLSKNECGSSVLPDVFPQSKDSELSGKKYIGLPTDWSIEIPERDVPSRNNGNVNKGDACCRDNGYSEMRKSMSGLSLNSRTHNSDRGIVAPSPVMNGSANGSSNQNGFRGRMNCDFRPNDVKTPEKHKHKKQGSSTDLKMGEGGDCQEESDNENSPPKQEEPGLSSACGDFLVTEDGDIDQQPSGEESTSQNQTEIVPILNFSPVNVQDQSVPYPNEEQNVQAAEENVLNFACLSDTDVSELDSDMSEEYLYDENYAEPEHENC